MNRRTSLLSALALAGVLAAALSGCATPAASGGPSSTPSDETDGGEVVETDVDAAWLDGGRIIGIVTQGSSTCVPSAGDVSFADGVLEVELVDPAPDEPCTQDLVPRATLAGTPEGVDPAQDVEIRVTGDGFAGETSLAGVAGLAVGGETDYAPSAGWAGPDGQFVILSWGSSSCPPVLQEVVASGPAEVTAMFVTPPQDQVCTMDMAPRGTVAQVMGLEAEGEATLVLEGGEFQDVRTTIIGSR